MSEEVKMPLPGSLQEIVGALLFASPDPLTAGELRDAVRSLDAEEGENHEIMDVYRTCTSREVDAALKGLGKALGVAGCGIELVCSNGAYRMQTVPSCGRYVRAMLKMDRPSRLGRASLETLAIIAYRQPLTKSEIEQIRGVDVTANIKTLSDLQLIRLVGKSELPGHPFLYGTTPLFLEHFGLSNLQQLNELDPTLQRSNPRLKAESYRKKEAPKDELKLDGKNASEAEAETEAEKAEEAVTEEVETGELPLDAPAAEEPSETPAADDDDDFFIDDTPEELVDDDDDEDGEEDDGEEEGDGEEDDEA